jgi:hypothetical protein
LIDSKTHGLGGGMLVRACERSATRIRARRTSGRVGDTVVAPAPTPEDGPDVHEIGRSSILSALP